MDCSAEFKIPASFTHDRAKCRQCGGTVEIEGAKAPTPKPTPAPVPAAVPPAPKPTPAPKAEAPVEEPAEKPLTMKEKILARKKAEAEAAAAAASKPAPKPAATPPRKPAAKAPGSPARRGKPAAAAGAAAAAGGRRSTGRKSAAKRGAEPEESGRRGRKAKPEKKTPVGGIIGIVVLLVGGAAGWYFLMGPGKSEPVMKDTQMMVGDMPAENAISEPDTDEPMAEEAGPTAEELAAEEAAKAAAAAAAAEAAAPPAEVVYDPSEVIYSDVPVFGPAVGCTTEEWDELESLMATAIDMNAGARQGRANKSLMEFGYKAFPVICNALREVDLGTDQGQRLGDMLQRNLEKLLNGRNFGWQYETEEDGTPTLKTQVFNRKVVRAYLGQWNKVVEDPIYWIGAAKLNGEPEQLDAYQAALDSAGLPTVDEEEGLDDF